MVNENINYEGHIIRYLNTPCQIDNLPMGKVLLGGLEKIGWVVLKFDYAITPNSKDQNYFYHLNNQKHPPKSQLWNKIHGTNRQKLYGINNHLHEENFVTEMNI